MEHVWAPVLNVPLVVKNCPSLLRALRLSRDQVHLPGPAKDRFVNARPQPPVLPDMAVSPVGVLQAPVETGAKKNKNWELKTIATRHR